MYNGTIPIPYLNSPREYKLKAVASISVKVDLLRKCQEIGLFAENKDGSSEIGKFLKYIFGLPFINQNEIENTFF